MTLFSTPHLCKVKRTYEPDYAAMDVWELAALHLFARERKDRETALQIEKVIKECKSSILMGKFKYYIEVSEW